MAKGEWLNVSIGGKAKRRRIQEPIMQYQRLSRAFIILLYMKQEELGMVYPEEWPGLT